MTVVLLAGLGSGIGILGVFAGLRKPRAMLDSWFIALQSDVTSTGPTGSEHQASWRLDQILGARLEEVLTSRSSIRSRFEAALSITDVSFATICSQAVLGGIVGFLLPVLCWGIVTLGGVHLSIEVPVWAAVVLALVGSAFPVLVLSSEVKMRRRAARRMIGSFLDLVVLCLAGGMGIEGALHAAAQAGDNPVLARVLEALTVARDSGTAPWAALAELGTKIGVYELTEVAAAVGLAGTQGARVRATLGAKAASIRRHELAEAETEANAITERMFLPGVLLLVGFLLFIGYPAVARIASGL